MEGRRYPQPLAQPSLRAVRIVIPRFSTDFVVLQFAPKSVLLCSSASRGCRLGGDAKGTRPTVGFYYYVVKWPTTAALKAGPPGQRAHCLLEFGRCVDFRMYRPRTKRDSRGQGGLAVVMYKMCGNGGTRLRTELPPLYLLRTQYLSTKTPPEKAEGPISRSALLLLPVCAIEYVALLYAD